MPDDPQDPSWPHLGKIDKWHVDLGEDHHHSPTLNPPPTDDGGNTLAGKLPPPFGKIPDPFDKR